MKEKVIQVADSIREKIWDLSTYLYENPEIGLQEFKSSKKIAEFLRNEGFEVEENLAGMATAFRATKKNGNGIRIVFTAEYDALPGIGHACGHHLIAAMSVGAGVALASALDTYEGEVTIIGTPSEETGDGKPYLIEHGVFDNFDAAMMIHPNSSTCLTPEMIAIGGLDFIFTGKAAHAGAMPYNGVNALDAVVLLYNNINALRQQLVDGTRVHGIILEAGKAANVIPDRGKVRLEIRAKEQDYFNKVVERIINCAKGAAMATGCELDFYHFEPTCQGLTHNKVLLDVFKNVMKDFGIEENGEVLLGSTDMGNVSQIIPTIHPMIQVTQNGEELHTKEFLESSIKPYSKEIVMDGIKMLALTGLNLFERPELIKKMKEE
ncbi:M20 family metallopeptidase [Clostridioides difficile]|uniref:M20 family metallopeptidase n=1 Tax=Clostridioides difficile TaxID=1496 RepID=UPI000C9A2FBF|nr:M20 family metallopeptidase [Clostridioides difficile]MBH6948909.1 M20 family metallopeptidase [Clostridioides difficile]MDI3072986.1 M20 family metallopeptidase [Clostridioides difficile]MDK3167357.1 M20 family metallopeptidase [Clostridioides difficile]NMU15906.1 M20 family metallopeptidase [Clostridioides difficile]